MAVQAAREYTYVDERELAGSGIGGSPSLIQNQLDLQAAAFNEGPAATDAAQQTANQGVSDAAAAQSSANTAQSTANQGVTDAATAQARANDAYTLAGTKVTKNVGPVFAAPTAAPSRAALPAYTPGTAGAVYTQADMQAVMDQVAALTSRLAGVITDLRGNGALRAS